MKNSMPFFGLANGLANASLAAGKNIYAASYAGPVFRLTLTDTDGSYSLEESDSTLDCGYNPGWLELDQVTGTLFCANEAYTIPNSGSLSSFSRDTFALLSNVATDYGPAQLTFYAPNRLGLVHYAGGAVSVWDTSNTSNLVELQSFHYFMDAPGPNITLQDKPYPHGIVSDPTGKFVVVLDRGADTLRTYSVGWDGRLIDLGAYFTEPGNGPRHAVFVKGTYKTFFLCARGAHELATRLRSVFYNDSAYQTGFGDASGHALPSEIAVAEGGTHIVLSTRNDGRSQYKGEPSDTIVSYSVDFETGDLKLVGLTASGGLWPRTFALSGDGRVIAIADQYSVPGRLIVFARDPKTGVIDDQEPLATWTTNITLPDGQSISHILWDEKLKEEERYQGETEGTVRDQVQVQGQLLLEEFSHVRHVRKTPQRVPQGRKNSDLYLYLYFHRVKKNLNPLHRGAAVLQHGRELLKERHGLLLQSDAFENTCRTGS
ncbi:Lactonase, 7-bladed beta-propeller-domain-containing protein [Leptodontidium sp. MPI-SDFR-AT-0119]|nr:Lactonase, 7-bladed beta-propeller-domain-containing protein [Leptodontidium sp. MPI-SDFR-AT-0119]